MTEQCILTELSPSLLGLGGGFFDTDIPGVWGKSLLSFVIGPIITFSFLSATSIIEPSIQIIMAMLKLVASKCLPEILHLTKTK
jgi:hypothetical protein